MIGIIQDRDRARAQRSQWCPGRCLVVRDKVNVTFAIKVDGVFIGSCRLFSFDRVAGTAELGIGIGDRDYQSQGYGREAVALLVDYGFRPPSLRKIWLKTSPANQRAIRSYQAVGLVHEGRQSQHIWSDGGTSTSC